jgi:hypothetical protein
MMVRAPVYTFTDLYFAGSQGRIYIWHGRGTKATDAQLARQIAAELLNRQQFPIEDIQEGQEPDDFWKVLHPTTATVDYEKEVDFVDYTRLFRCTNEKGFFAVSEKTIDFCQVSTSVHAHTHTHTGRPR